VTSINLLTIFDKERPTRGKGLLEGFLAYKRAEMANKLIENKCRNGKILDIGCGSHPLFLLKTNFKNKFGIDKHELNEYEEFFKQNNIIFNVYDLEKDVAIPYEDNSFEIVTMLAVFEHIEPEKLDGVINEIHRILKQDGSFILTTPAKWTHNILKLMTWLKLVSKVEFLEHKDLYNHEKISKILIKNGFLKNKILKGFFESFMNLWLLAKK
jgi:SAM-dependent methyltransferase